MTPNPGSPEALDLGCKCPVMDNHYGQGRPSKDGPLFVYNMECPLHVRRPCPPAVDLR
jgi:hypothetical protein